MNNTRAPAHDPGARPSVATDGDASTSPSGESRVSLENWDLPPFNHWSFQNMDRIFPVASVSRGTGPVTEFASTPVDLDDIPVERADRSKATVSDVLGETETDGFLVLHRGKIVYEKYFRGMQPHTLHLTQSVSKSIVGTLAGIYVDRGLLQLAAPVAELVPELSDSAYADASVGEVLHMQTGVMFNEDYTDPDAEFALLDVAAGWKPARSDGEPETIRELLRSVGRQRNHGEYFEYRSIDSDVIAWLCEKAGGEPLQHLVSREIWSKLGAEHDASFTVDKAGTALADGGFSATLRDLGRFGQMHLDRGQFGDESIVSGEWIDSCRCGSTEAFGVLYGHYAEHYPDAAYANQWWVLDVGRGTYSARGIFGQMIYIDPDSELVAVKLSSWPTHLDLERTLNSYRAVEAIADQLSTEARP